MTGKQIRTGVRGLKAFMEAKDILSSVPVAGSGGFAWCDMCGYTAALTEPMLKEWDEDDTDPQACYRICQLCEAADIDSHLRHGRELPDHIAEDDPMPEYSQNDEMTSPHNKGENHE